MMEEDGDVKEKDDDVKEEDNNDDYDDCVNYINIKPIFIYL